MFSLSAEALGASSFSSTRSCPSTSGALWTAAGFEVGLEAFSGLVTSEIADDGTLPPVSSLRNARTLSLVSESHGLYLKSSRGRMPS